MQIPTPPRRRPWIALGGFFFRQRGWTPIPWILLLVFCTVGRTSRDWLTWAPGLLCLALGEGLRLWGVAVVGKESRTRGGGVARLATHGPYAHVRNPLYLGNFFLTLGAAFISGLLWMVPVAILLYVIQYVPIVLWEESILADRFQAQYVAYRRRVPRWIPTWDPLVQSASAPPYQWRAAFYSERSTFGVLAVLLIGMAVKEDLVQLRALRAPSVQSSSAAGVIP